MAWRLTESLDEFFDAAGTYLRSDPAQNTVLLTVLQTLRHSGGSVYGDDPPFFGWHESDGKVDGALLRTPPFPLLAAKLPPGTAASLITQLAGSGRKPTGANVNGADEPEVVTAWTAATGGSVTARSRSRLFRLTGLVPPDPLPAGTARTAAQGDFDLLADWHRAFHDEVGGGPGEHPERMVADKLSHGGLTVWEVDGKPVAMAGLTRAVAGVIRVAPVYTLPAHRQRGYGGAVTTAVSQSALDAGAAEVVLFTDLANPTSNALYQRLGYRPISDRVLLDLGVTGGPGASS